MEMTSALQCGWAAVHLAGLVATFLVRAYAGTRADVPMQGLFLVGLSGVGAATLAGSHLCWPLWLVSAGTLAVMIVAAVADFGPRGGESWR
ncbi:MAG TPA: hypothetical protein PKC18_06435 [Lacipirellulaceae bacterium]|mgnify:CR=1 FL=1|nr:hypothetical protein [Lacipirellulaceae bacterium]HMP05324.1 hypothetical protein [Lacipirellulaceae bacterium]